MRKRNRKNNTDYGSGSLQCLSFFLTKKIGEAIKDFNDTIYLLHRLSSRKQSSLGCVMSSTCNRLSLSNEPKNVQINLETKKI